MRPILLALLLVAGACTLADADTDPVDPTAESTPPPTGEAIRGEDTETSAADLYRAPAFPEDLEWLNTSAPLTLADLEGKVIVLDFWTHGCINCLHVIPDLKRLEAEYPEELVVIGVHSAKFETEAATSSIRDFVLRHDVRHPIVNDADFEVWRSYGVRAWPTTWVIGPDGQLVGRHEGEGVYEVVQPVVDRLISEQAGMLDRSTLDLQPERKIRTVLAYPTKLAVDGDRDRLFVADTGHHQVVAVRLSTGEVEAVWGAGSPGYRDGGAEEAQFDGPRGLAVSEDGTTLFVADTGNHTIRAIDVTSGLVTTLAGTGRQGGWPPMGGDAGAVPLHSPWDLERVDDVVYVAMAGSHQIWALDLEGGNIRPYAGSGREATDGGPRLGAALAQPSGLASDGSRLWFADAESSSVRVVAGDEVSLVAGAAEDLFTFGQVDGVGADARFQHPLGVAWDGGTIWVADTYNSAIRSVDPAGVTTTLVGGDAGWADGPDPRFDQPGGIEAWNGLLYVADTNNHAIRIVDPTTGVTDTLVLSGIERFRRPAEDGVIALPAAVVGSGSVELVLDVEFPAGYKVNPDAPASVTWGGGVGAVEPATVTVVEPEFPLSFSLTVESPGVLVGDVSVVFCREDQESICLFEQIRVEQPVAVDVEGGDRIEVLHTVRLPDGLEP